jgi:hypothetical protein
LKCIASWEASDRPSSREADSSVAALNHFEQAGPPAREQP